MKSRMHAFCLFLIGASALYGQRNYRFDGKISREVLENYLSRSITMTEIYRSPGNLDDDIRMLKNIGAKFAGRTIYLWGGEARINDRGDERRHLPLGRMPAGRPRRARIVDSAANDIRGGVGVGGVRLGHAAAVHLDAIRGGSGRPVQLAGGVDDRRLRNGPCAALQPEVGRQTGDVPLGVRVRREVDRKSTRLNSSHLVI